METKEQLIKINQTVLNIREASLYLSLRISRLRYEVFHRRIPFIKIGRSVRFSTTALDEWLEAQKVEVKS